MNKTKKWQLEQSYREYICCCICKHSHQVKKNDDEWILYCGFEQETKAPKILKDFFKKLKENGDKQGLIFNKELGKAMEKWYKEREVANHGSCHHYETDVRASKIFSKDKTDED